MKVGIFGCTADPFTVAHKEICRTVVEKYNLDELWIVPTVVEYHRKGKQRMFSDHERCFIILEMLCTILNEPWVYRLWDNELRLKALYHDIDVRHGTTFEKDIIGERRFFHTLLELKASVVNQNAEVFLIVGQDSLNMMPTWYQWKLVLEQLSGVICVKGREGETSTPKEIEEEFRRAEKSLEYITLSDDLLKVSASNVRDTLSNLEGDEKIVKYLKDVKAFSQGYKSITDLKWDGSTQKEKLT